MAVSAKLQTLRAGRKLQAGGLLAHQTSTLSGVAAAANSAVAIKKLQRFKQRQAPYLLLADSLATALRQSVWISTELRKLAKQSWPGSVTLVVAARAAVLQPCLKRGCVALRVDADQETRRLAALSGGLLLSSSLNRKGNDVQQVCFKLKFRWHRHLASVLHHQQPSSGKASTIFKLVGNKVQQLR